MFQFKMISAVRGHHIYKSIWTPEIGERLLSKRGQGNRHNRHAVAVTKGRLTVGHLPADISKICWFFLHKGGSIGISVSGPRRRSALVQGGLEVPCELTFNTDKEKIFTKLKKLLAS